MYNLFCTDHPHPPYGKKYTNFFKFRARVRAYPGKPYLTFTCFSPSFQTELGKTFLVNSKLADLVDIKSVCKIKVKLSTFSGLAENIGGNEIICSKAK